MIRKQIIIAYNNLKDKKDKMQFEKTEYFKTIKSLYCKGFK